LADIDFGDTTLVATSELFSCSSLLETIEFTEPGDEGPSGLEKRPARGGMEDVRETAVLGFGKLIPARFGDESLTADFPASVA
jgi:hypothetical protein